MKKYLLGYMESGILKAKMKYAFGIFFLCAVASVSAFGFFMMGHGNGPNLHGCLASTIMGRECPDAERLFSYLAFHLDAFRSFGAAVFASGLLFLLFVIFAAIAFSELFDRLTFRKTLSFCTRDRFFSPSRARLLFWLSFHEYSPSIA